MNITDFYHLEGQNLSFTRQQGSDFAKKVAHDFNPIHDIDHKRFCVPGDLLFSVMLHHYGLHQHMHFTFSGMVDDTKTIILPDCDSSELELKDTNDKTCLSIKCDGESSQDNALIHALSNNYVQFSGQAFPHILVPLMRDNQVMINPDRPLVMYQSMCLSLDTLNITTVDLAFVSSQLTVNGKRGQVSLNYHLKEGDRIIGKGEKKMLLSGLRAYDAAKMDEVIAYYNERRHQLA